MAAIPIEKDAIAGPVPIEDLARVAAQRGEPDRAIAALQKLLSLPYNGGLGALATHTRAAPGSIQCSIRSGTIRVFRNSPSRPRRRCPTNNATWCRSNLVAELTLQIIWQGFSRARGVVQRVCQSELLDSILSETRHVPARRVVRRHDHREKYSARPCEYLRHFLEK
jgi:hypothetical protein